MKHTEQGSTMGRKPSLVGQYGGWVALAAAAALTSKGEYDLAVMVHYPWFLAWLFPVALDVYLATAATRKAGSDVAISLLLMVGAQIAVHLTDHFITEGEQVPWGLIIPVSCIPPIVAWRAKSLASGHKAEAEAAAEAEREQQRIRAIEAARAEVADANRRRAEAEARVRKEQEARAEVERAAEERLREEQEAREAAEQGKRAAEEKAARAAFRAAQARTERDGDASARRTPAARVTKPVTHPVTHDEAPTDAPVTHAVTHRGDARVRHGDAPAGGDASRDASTGDAQAGREERLTLAVWEVLEGTQPSARAAALKHDVDVQAVQRRVRAERQQRGVEEQSPLARAGVNGVKPDLTVTPK